MHRALVLLAMMVLAAGAFVLLTAAGVASFDSHSLIALVLVVIVAVVGGVAFSWKRYGRRN